MKIRTPSTSAELALEAHSRTLQGRRHGREPQRLPLQGGYAPLLLDGPLDPRHPLYDSASGIRRKRILEERRRRGL